jgi:DNA-binding XRE family transcriptional regulator
MSVVGKSKTRRKRLSKSTTRAPMKKRHIDDADDYNLPLTGEMAMKQIEEWLQKPSWAIFLSGYRKKAGLTQKQLGEMLNLKISNISAMEHGRRAIGKNLAMRLAAFFNTDYHNFL